MPGKKTANLSSSLVAVKGQAIPCADATGRHAEPLPPPANGTANLNFKVAPEFKRRFRQRAIDADLKLCELLHEALTAWEEKRSID